MKHSRLLIELIMSLSLKVICKVAKGTKDDVDYAVEAAQVRIWLQAFCYLIAYVLFCVFTITS